MSYPRKPKPHEKLKADGTRKGLMTYSRRLEKEVHFVTVERDQLRADLKTATEALEFYADGFRIMDHIDGTYTIHETWYEKARTALAAIGKGKE